MKSGNLYIYIYLDENIYIYIYTHEISQIAKRGKKFKYLFGNKLDLLH